jgi:carbon monoxide dehydrogenase subunit G
VQIEGSYYLKGSPAEILKLMVDPEVLSKCIPGCKGLREMMPDKYWYRLTYGYEGMLRVGKISSPSRILCCTISIFRSILSILGAYCLKFLAVFKDLGIHFASKMLEVCPSFLDGLRVEVAMDGKGTAGSINAMGVAELRLQTEGLLVQYEGHIYLGGVGSLLQIKSSLVGGLDFKKLVCFFFQGLQTELYARTKLGIFSKNTEEVSGGREKNEGPGR